MRRSVLVALLPVLALGAVALTVIARSHDGPVRPELQRPMRGLNQQLTREQGALFANRVLHANPF